MNHLLLFGRYAEHARQFSNSTDSDDVIDSVIQTFCTARITGDWLPSFAYITEFYGLFNSQSFANLHNIEPNLGVLHRFHKFMKDLFKKPLTYVQNKAITFTCPSSNADINSVYFFNFYISADHMSIYFSLSTPFI